MRAAVIENGVVVNLIEVEALDFLPGLVAANDAHIGDTWDGARFARPSPVVAVPLSVTMRQAKLALRRAGVLAAVDAQIAAMPGDVGDDARIEWQYGNDVDRNSQLIVSLMPALGMTEAQIDELFIAAATL